MRKHYVLTVIGNLRCCSRCREWKTFDCFAKHKTNKSGLHNQCVSCASDYQKKRYEIRKETVLTNTRNYKASIIGQARTLFRSAKERAEQRGFAPSIDQIKPSEGYTPENIQIVCNMFNMGKSDLDELDFLAMCVAVAERYRNDPAVILRLLELRNAGL